MGGGLASAAAAAKDSGVVRGNKGGWKRHRVWEGMGKKGWVEEAKLHLHLCGSSNNKGKDNDTVAGRRRQQRRQRHNGRCS